MSFLASFLQKKNRSLVSDEPHLLDVSAHMDKAWDIVQRMIANIQGNHSVFEHMSPTDLETFVEVIEDASLRRGLLKTCSNRCSVDDLNALYRTPFVKRDAMERRAVKGIRHIKRCMAKQFLNLPLEDHRREMVQKHIAVLQQEALHEFEEGVYNSIGFGTHDGRPHRFQRAHMVPRAFTRAWTHACAFLFQHHIPSVHEVVAQWNWQPGRFVALPYMSEGIQQLHKMYPSALVRKDMKWHLHGLSFCLGGIYLEKIPSSEERMFVRTLSTHRAPGELRSFAKELLASVQWFLASGTPEEMISWTWHHHLHDHPAIQEYLWTYVIARLSEDSSQRMIDFMYILSTGSLKSTACSLPSSAFESRVSPHAQILGSLNAASEMMHKGNTEQLLSWWDTHYLSTKTAVVLPIDTFTLASMESP